MSTSGGAERMRRAELYTRLRREVDRGNAARAAELLLEAKGIVADQYRAIVRSGGLSLPLSNDGRHLKLARALGAPTNGSKPKPGVFSLAVHDDGTEAVGSVRRLYMIPGPTPPEWSSFSVSCQLGRQAALCWLANNVALPDAFADGAFALERIWGAAVQPDTEEQHGESAALPAALAHLLGHAPLAARYRRRIAATGRVAGAAVLPVNSIGAKLEAAVREAPWLDAVYVPAGCEGQVSASIRASMKEAKIELVPIQKVDELLAAELLPDDMRLTELFTTLSPVDAAQRAWDLEREQDHAGAFVYASQLRESRESWTIGGPDAQLAEIQARAVWAIISVHWGQTAAAAVEMARVVALTEQAPRGLLDADTRLLLAAYRISIAIDQLDAPTAMEICEEHGRHAEIGSASALSAFFGSKARALALGGARQEAIEANGMQLALALRAGDKHQRPHMLCNRADLLFRCLAEGDDVVNEIEATLKEAETANAQLPHRIARQKNASFIGLWRCRLCAELGDARGALELAGEIGKCGRFPNHYRHRFAGQALARSGAVSQALDYLAHTVAAISDDAGPFEALVLHGAAAAAALIRIDNNLDDWREQAAGYLERVHDYAPGFVKLPPVGADRTVYAATLRDVLARLPY